MLKTLGSQPRCDRVPLGAELGDQAALPRLRDGELTLAVSHRRRDPLQLTGDPVVLREDPPVRLEGVDRVRHARRPEDDLERGGSAAARVELDEPAARAAAGGTEVTPCLHERRAGRAELPRQQAELVGGAVEPLRGGADLGIQLLHLGQDQLGLAALLLDRRLGDRSARREQDPRGRGDDGQAGPHDALSIVSPTIPDGQAMPPLRTTSRTPAPGRRSPVSVGEERRERSAAAAGTAAPGGTEAESGP